MLRAGGVWRDIPAAGAVEVMGRVVSGLPGASEELRTELARRLRSANGISWAPVGDGLALPHFRPPAELEGDGGAIALIFLREPMAVTGEAPDGATVTRLLFLVAPSPRHHLEILGRLSRALIHADLRRLVLEGATDAELFAAFGRA
jgi:PTS system nitrogen regulatory IIA component